MPFTRSKVKNEPLDDNATTTDTNGVTAAIPHSGTTQQPFNISDASYSFIMDNLNGEDATMHDPSTQDQHDISSGSTIRNDDLNMQDGDDEHGVPGTMPCRLV
jgi:hypothetical protein